MTLFRSRFDEVEAVQIHPVYGACDSPDWFWDAVTSSMVLTFDFGDKYPKDAHCLVCVTGQVHTYQRVNPWDYVVRIPDTGKLIAMSRSEFEALFCLEGE